ncbi:MAG: SMP-30/gluconolactonase/LRE family protein [Rhodospirillaceae bacterium]|nr:SMP-30/gluconolactonase/LRE family protein [Rhodospirillaceae bacterium]MCA8932921.1 SMP-30/gluconolactonase/LRE family protein [Rhodospirillaceae bacterium]
MATLRPIGPAGAAVCAVLMALPGAAAAQNVTIVNPDTSFPEGPLWHGGQLYYVEYGANTVMVWDGAENHEVWRQDGCGPSAVIAVTDETFAVTCYDSGTMELITPTGEPIETIDADDDGNPLHGPNDAVADGAGGFYFSASGIWDAAAPIEGRVYLHRADGSTVEVANDIHYSNGVALSPDGTSLYVSEMGAQRVLRFTRNADGTLGNRYLFARLSDLAPDLPEFDIYMGPDGLRTDAAGNVYIAQFEGGRILVADPDGQPVEVIEIPALYVDNMEFGDDESVLFVTAVIDAWTEPYPGQVYRIERE